MGPQEMSPNLTCNGLFSSTRPIDAECSNICLPLSTFGAKISECLGNMHSGKADLRDKRRNFIALAEALPPPVREFGWMMLLVRL